MRYRTSKSYWQIYYSIPIERYADPFFLTMMQQSNNNNNLVKKGQFYFIYNNGQNLVLEDKTKRGLEVQEHILDQKYGVEADRGVIYDMDGIGHRVGIRWYFNQSKYTLDNVIEIAEEIESRYKAIREMTCPDD